MNRTDAVWAVGRRGPRVVVVRLEEGGPAAKAPLKGLVNTARTALATGVRSIAPPSSILARAPR